MSSSLARENSIWNMLFHGKPRVPAASVEVVQSYRDEPEDAQSHPTRYCDEKKRYLDNPEKSEKNESVAIPYEHKPKKREITWSLILILVIGFALLGHGINNIVDYIAFSSTGRTNSLVDSKNLMDSFNSGVNVFDADGTAPPKQVFEVSFPFVKPINAPVYSSLLVNHTFGNSWGKPAIEKILAPPKNVTFNKVVLTLNTSVDGVQYDRLANIFIDGVQIWRTSTAEPGGGPVYSTFDKDVSKYLKLFEQNNATVLFQLDNLLTPRLTGEFHVELYASYFNVLSNSTSPASKHLLAPMDVSELDPTAAILSRHGPASEIYGLTTHSNSEEPPISYLPSDKIQVALPEVPFNTTRLTLSVFTSGNSAEEFWYTNVLDRFVHTFDKYGKTLLGHGPVRILNVYFNGEKIAVQTPEPVIFTGGISPALWSPMVGTSAFDIESINIDVTGLLPYLWSTQSIEDRLLEIEVSNGYDELTTWNPNAPKSGIAENWITSANLLTFESDKVLESQGSVVLVNDTKDITTVAISPPYSGFISQIITSKFGSILESVLQFTLVDGSFLNTSVVLVTSSKIVNIQRYTHAGSSQSVVHVGTSDKSITFIDNGFDAESKKNKNKKKKNLAANVIAQVNASIAHPFIGQLDDKTLGSGSVIEYDVSVVTGKNIEIVHNGLTVFKEKTGQNGTSTYFLAGSGNHGFGSLETKYKLDTKYPLPDLKYKRKVIAENGTVTSDVVKLGDSDLESKNYYEFEFSDEEYGIRKLFEMTVDDLSQKLNTDLQLVKEIADLEITDFSFISMFFQIMKDSEVEVETSTKVKSKCHGKMKKMLHKVADAASTY